MSLSINTLVPKKRYLVTCIVNQIGWGKQTDAPTRMVYDVRIGDIYGQHVWIAHTVDVRMLKYMKFGEEVSFTGEAYIYDDGKMSLRNLENVKRTGNVASWEKIMEMCKVKDGGKSARNHEACPCEGCAKTKIAANQRMYFGFSRNGKELHFHTPECREAYMRKVFG